MSTNRGRSRRWGIRLPFALDLDRVPYFWRAGNREEAGKVASFCRRRPFGTSLRRRGEQVKIDRSAGKPADPAILVNVAKLVSAYYDVQPDLVDPKQRVVFGTSGHRGSAFEGTFNEWHILAITQAICDYRKAHKIDGPLFLGMDTHALSEPAFASALEVLAANSVDVMLSDETRYT